ncbi:hypothetical protein [Streptomyces sp. NPDC004788]
MTVSSPLRPSRTPVPPAPRPAVGAGLFDRLAPRLHRCGLLGLRWGLGGVFVWFGVLKVIGRSPAAQLVVDVIPFDTGGWFVPALGWIEVVFGVWLISARARAALFPLLAGHLLGTFSVLVLTPHAAFDHADPLLLTMIGEFVVKNLVLLAAAVVVTTQPRPTP